MRLRRQTVVPVLAVLLASSSVFAGPTGRAAADGLPTISVYPTVVTSGGQTRLSGYGVTPGQQFDVFVGTAPVGTTTANEFGSMFSTITVPTGTTPGSVPVTVVRRSDHRTLQQSLEVKNDWVQRGYDGGASFGNPAEYVLRADTVAALRQAWTVDADELGPVANGYVFGDDGGATVLRRPATGVRAAVLPSTVVAVLRWLSISVENGVLTARDTYSGKVSWSRALPPDLRETAYVSADTSSAIYLLHGSTLTKINGLNGSQEWDYPVQANSRHLVADETGAYLVSTVGTDIAELFAYTADGYRNWGHSDGSAHDWSGLVLGGGRVYLIEDGARVLALGQTSGTEVWRRSLSPQTLAYAHERLVVSGSSDTALAADTGAVLWSRDAGGRSALAGDLVFRSAAGGLQVLSGATGSVLTTKALPVGAIVRTIEVANGQVYLWEDLRGADGTGTGSAIAAFGLPSVPPSFLRLDDTAAELSYGSGWKIGQNTGDYRGADHYTETAGSTTTFRFTGTGFRYWYSVAPHHGIAAVRIDGGAETRIDEYGSPRLDGSTSWTSPRLALGTHTVTIRSTGGRNPNATARVITVDRIELGRN